MYAMPKVCQSSEPALLEMSGFKIDARSGTCKLPAKGENNADCYFPSLNETAGMWFRHKRRST